jgi:hypothetical protein
MRADHEADHSDPSISIPRRLIVAERPRGVARSRAPLSKFFADTSLPVAPVKETLPARMPAKLKQER